MKASNESLAALYNDRVVALELLKHVGDAYNDIVDIAHKVGAASLSPADGRHAAQGRRRRRRQASWKAYLRHRPRRRRSLRWSSRWSR